MTRGKKVTFTDEQVAIIEDCALLGCRTLTIAEILGVPESTLRLKFAKFMTKKRAIGKLKLRRAQREKATKTKDTAMLIFLGKNDLGQEDKKTIKQDGTITHDISPELMALGKQMAEKYAQEAK